MAAMTGSFGDHLAELERIVTTHGHGRSSEASLAAAQQVLIRLQASEEALDAYVMSTLCLIAARLPVLYSDRRHRDHEGGAGGVRGRTLADCAKVRSRLLRLGRERSERRIW